MFATRTVSFTLLTLVTAGGALGVPIGAAPAADVISFEVPGRANATPWVTADGSFVVVAWGASASGRADVFVAVSPDAGATFGAPVQVNRVVGEARLGGELPPRVALVKKDRSDPEIVVLWTTRGVATEIKTSRSRNGGTTFDSPVTLQSAGAAGDRGWPAVALDQQGAAHAIWLDHRGLAAARGTTADHAHHQMASTDGVAMAQKSALYYAATGAPVSAERELTKGVCYCCKTALAVGPDDVLYAAWRHVYPGDLRDIALTVSRNRGRSFSPPVRVSKDDWAINACPDDGPAMAIDAQGVVHIVWPTVIGGATPEGGLFYSSTRDGRTFTPRTRVPTLGSPKPSHPQIVVDRSGRIVVAWDESLNGRRTAALREVKPVSGGLTFGEIIELAPAGTSAYPVLAATPNGLVAVWTQSGDPTRVQGRAIQLR
jgi:hypothetical protein